MAWLSRSRRNKSLASRGGSCVRCWHLSSDSPDRECAVHFRMLQPCVRQSSGSISSGNCSVYTMARLRSEKTHNQRYKWLRSEKTHNQTDTPTRRKQIVWLIMSLIRTAGCPQKWSNMWQNYRTKLHGVVNREYVLSQTSFLGSLWQQWDDRSHYYDQNHKHIDPVLRNSTTLTLVHHDDTWAHPIEQKPFCNLSTSNTLLTWRRNASCHATWPRKSITLDLWTCKSFVKKESTWCMPFVRIPNMTTILPNTGDQTVMTAPKW